MSKKKDRITIEDLKMSEKELEALVTGAQRFLAAEPDPRDEETQPKGLTPRENSQS